MVRLPYVGRGSNSNSVFKTFMCLSSPGMPTWEVVHAIVQFSEPLLCPQVSSSCAQLSGELGTAHTDEKTALQVFQGILFLVLQLEHWGCSLPVLAALPTRASDSRTKW